MAVLSGQYGPRTGGYRVSSPHLDYPTKTRFVVPDKKSMGFEKITMAEAFKEAGYSTAMYGKWHVGNTGSEHPVNHGFDVGYVCTKYFNTGMPPAKPTGRNSYSMSPRFSYQITKNLSGAVRFNFNRAKNIASGQTTTSLGLGLEATFVF